jgi:uncharacterized repeat protein (TIGR03833 family)
VLTAFRKETNMEILTSGKDRAFVRIGSLVDIVLKNDQSTGNLTRGHVREILTKSQFHPKGIKVRLMENSEVGRIRYVYKEQN